MIEVMELRKLSVDKSDWQKTKLLELAEEISERSDSPGQSKYERFVGLEHFVSGDLKIKNWGSTKELGSSMKVFKAGDVLFARRNAYLRRASLVEFDGICSGDAFVLRENHNKIVPGFLAFVLNSDAVWNFANSNAAGTMSKRVKWRDLGEYEFLLPPKDQQARLAELFWSADEVVEKSVTLQKDLDIFLKVKREELIKSKTKHLVALQEICKKKISYGIVQAGPNFIGGMPYIKSSDLTDEGISLEKLEFTSFEIAKKYERSEVESGDVIFSLRGNLGVVNIVPEQLPKANLTQGTARLSVNQSVINEYLVTAIETIKVQREIHALSKGSTFKEISLEALRKVKIPLPDTLRSQKSIINQVKSIKNVIRRCKIAFAQSKQLQKSLINQIF